MINKMQSTAYDYLSAHPKATVADVAEVIPGGAPYVRNVLNALVRLNVVESVKLYRPRPHNVYSVCGPKPSMVEEPKNKKMEKELTRVRAALNHERNQTTVITEIRAITAGMDDSYRLMILDAAIKAMDNESEKWWRQAADVRMGVLLRTFEKLSARYQKEQESITRYMEEINYVRVGE